MKHILSAAAVLGLVAAAVSAAPADASIIAYSGTDSGAASSGPFPNSSAAQANFESAAASYGALHTITFENLATGAYNNIHAAPGVTINWSSPYGNPYSGIIAGNPFNDNLYGFNVTPGGNQWFGFGAGSATFSFASGTNSFGFWLTGLQTVFTLPGDLTVTFNDGVAEQLLPKVTANGGAEYFAFTDSTKIYSVTIANPSNDAWGIDDVTYNGPSAVPEPGTLLLFGSGLLGLGALRRRKKEKQKAA